MLRYVGNLLRVGYLLMSICFWLILPSLAHAQGQYDGVYGSGANPFILATGSPGELGLLKALGEVHAAKENATLLWKKAGSGEALRLLKEKKVDAIMVHDPDGEKKAIAEGWAVGRTLIGSNEFFIVGPVGDPAGISQAKSAAQVYQRIAASRSKFFSRGDHSGTHKKELAIWKKAGIEPQGEWYLIAGGFMRATLERANDEQGYFMTDSSTWIMEKGNLPGLKVLFRGDKFLVNTYHALCQPPKATPGAPWAAEFIEFVASADGQEIIRTYGKEDFKEALYNDAVYAKQYE